MDKVKPTINIVADESNDLAIIDFLKINYTIETIVNPTEMYERVIERHNTDYGSPFRGEDDMEFEFVIVNDNPDTVAAFQDLFYLFNKGFVRTPKFLAFGEAGNFLGMLNSASILSDITNHVETSHLVTFCMEDERLLEFEVTSNHNQLIYPSQNSNFEILAFSSHNRSNSYTDTDNGRTFKAERNFLELEGVKFPETNSYCFMYEVPTSKQSVLIDLTSQFITR